MGKYLFLYMKTGGGHLAPAKAIAERINNRKDANTDVHLVDGLSESHYILKKILEDGYRTAVNKAVWTFEFLYLLHKIKIVSRTSAVIISSIVESDIEKLILETNPDKIVIFHFFLTRPVFKIITKYKLNIPVITVVTDPFTAHPVWFLQEGQNYILFSDLLRERCIKRGIGPNTMRVFPFVLNGKFSQEEREPAESIKRMKFGFSPSSRIILILGGGEGLPGGEAILRKVIGLNTDAEIAIVCGNNMNLYSAAMSIKERLSSDNLHVFGFVDFVHSLLSISDIVITKCGASATMEILMMGKIPVISNYIWEQEKGNMEFVCSQDMGILVRNRRLLPEVINKLMTDREYYNYMSENVKKAALKNGLDRVTDFIINFQQSESNI